MLFNGPYAEQAVKCINSVSNYASRQLTYNTDDIKCCIIAVQAVRLQHKDFNQVKGVIYYWNGAKAHIESAAIHIGAYNAFCRLEELSAQQFEHIKEDPFEEHRQK